MDISTNALLFVGSIGVFLHSQSINNMSTNRYIYIRIPVAEECISAFNQLRSGPEATRPKFIICKISDDKKSIVLEETSTEKDWDFFRMKLCEAADEDGDPAPRYAIYNMKYDIGSEGKQ